MYWNILQGAVSEPNLFEHAQLRLGEGYAGQAALARETVHIPNLAAQQ